MQDAVGRQQALGFDLVAAKQVSADTAGFADEQEPGSIVIGR